MVKGLEKEMKFAKQLIHLKEKNLCLKMKLLIKKQPEVYMRISGEEKMPLSCSRDLSRAQYLDIHTLAHELIVK